MPESPDPSVQTPGRSHWVEGKRGLPSAHPFLFTLVPPAFPPSQIRPFGNTSSNHLCDTAHSDYIDGMSRTLKIRKLDAGNPEEIARLYEICLRTGADGQDATDIFHDRKLLGELYVGAYARFHPELAFVLVDQDDFIQGYAVGVSDSVAFDNLLDRHWWPWLRARYPAASPLVVHPKDTGLVNALHNWSGTDRTIAATYPAHLHIDLLPSAQGGGNGKRLLLTLLDELRDAGATGVHLGVSATNKQAQGFYEHLGFTVLSRGNNAIMMGLAFTM